MTWLIIKEPRILIPMGLGIGGIYLVRRTWSRRFDWRAQRALERALGDPPAPKTMSRKLSQVSDSRRRTEGSSEFSAILFQDFAAHLFSRVHEARANGLEQLSAYVGADARETLAELGLVREVEAVIIGAAQLEPTDGCTHARVRFTANYTEIDARGARVPLYVEELWTFKRGPDAKPRSKERTRVLDCPNCGAPLKEARDNKCASCSAKLVAGHFDWGVSQIDVLDRQTALPALTTHSVERGHDSPTIVAEDVADARARLIACDPAFAWKNFIARVESIYVAVNDAWSRADWQAARAVVSDSIFQTQRYWLEAYERQGLRNLVEGARVTKIELAKIESDKYFDAITVRVFATGLDFTIDLRTNAVVSGERDRPRDYSEYWTFIRSVTAPTVDLAKPKQCPQCGADLAINQSGECRYCKAHVTSGEFDWVLSRIEQDDAYLG